MKKFIVRFILFIIPIFVLLIISIPIYIYKKNIVNERIKSISEYESIIMGDSQMQRIDPEYFTKPTYNFAVAAEHYFYTYQKLRKLADRPDFKIKSILLGVSAHNFSPIYNKLYDLNYTEGSFSFQRFFYFSDIVELVKKSGKYSLVIKSILSNSTEWGGVYKSNNANPDTTIVNLNLKSHYDGSNSICKTQIEYLDSIVNYCDQKKIKLYLVSTPYHSNYLSKVNPLYFQVLYNTTRKYKNVSIINYLDNDVNPNFMSDGNHLNTTGSKFYSKKLNEIINVVN